MVDGIGFFFTPQLLFVLAIPWLSSFHRFSVWKSNESNYTDRNTLTGMLLLALFDFDFDTTCSDGSFSVYFQRKPDKTASFGSFKQISKQHCDLICVHLLLLLLFRQFNQKLREQKKIKIENTAVATKRLCDLCAIDSQKCNTKR